jgi:hypothetical protein
LVGNPVFRPVLVKPEAHALHQSKGPRIVEGADENYRALLQFTEGCQLFATELEGLTFGLNQTSQASQRDHVSPSNAGTAAQLLGGHHRTGGQRGTANAQHHGNGRIQNRRPKLIEHI